MLTLNDGRSELWQWDTGRTLAVDADCSQVHFSNKVFGHSIDVDVINGAAIIPDILLQTDKDLNVWAFVGTAENGYTKISKTFKVNRRNKPSDYVFTPPDQTSLEEIKEKIDYLESIQDPDAIKNAVNDYLEQNPVEAPVKSVNGQTGKVELTAKDVGAISQDDLQEATNKALAQAKESGEFDGKDGAPGADGHTPEYGVDYGTPEQIAGIAQSAAEILQPDVNQIKEELAKKVPKSDYAPEAKTDAMTQPVGKDSDGKLWTAPGSGGGGIAVSGATVGQTVRIAAVDDNGVPTAWEPVDLPSGGGKWRKIADLTTTEDVKEILISQDMNGKPFALKEVRIATWAAAVATGTGYDYCVTEVNGSSIVVGQNSGIGTNRYYRYAYYSVAPDGTGFGWFVSTNINYGGNPIFSSFSCKNGRTGLEEANHGFPITSVGFKHIATAGRFAAGVEMVVYGIDA